MIARPFISLGASRAEQGSAITRPVSRATVLLLASAMAWPVAAQEQVVPSDGASADSLWLEREFPNPPASARPRVWWHWMNGNISKDGIRKDLEWMKRTGIGGVQTFEADIATPQIVDSPLAYMSAGWKDAFRFAASEADRLGLEMAIPASPGFSETGGPWVKPQDAMKKIAWSETTITGGRPFRGKLPRPPQTSGPFQDTPHHDLMAPVIPEIETPDLYQDTALFAYRVASGPASGPVAVKASVAGRPLDAALLSDGIYANGIKLPKALPGKSIVVDLTLDKAQPVRSVTIFMRGAFQIFRPGVVFPRLEASTDGTSWRKVTDLGLNFLPMTFSFPAVEERFFRLVLVSVPGAGSSDANAAPGADPAPFDAFQASPDIELAEVRLSTEAQVDRWQAKAGFASMPDRYAPDPGLPDEERGVSPGEVIDLSGKMAPDGTLNWTPPAGTWRVVRMGWSLLGTTNHPAPAAATGLEVDKLDRDAVRRYLEAYLGQYRDAAGTDLIGKRGIQALLTDSTEVGMFNWTPQLLAQFQRLRGYDPRPWLPALTGAIVGTRGLTDRFLYDFRRTLGDLHATEHYGTVAAFAHENGLKVYGESLEGSSGSPGDDLDMRRYADIPMGAQWTYRPDGKPQSVHEADMRGAASVAHFYGRDLVAAESLTSSSNPWAFAPADLRPTIDLILAGGVNRPIIHTSAHVPRDDRFPGLSLWIYGQYFNRLDTWAEMARPWVDYISRSSLMLQAGKPVADVAYFYGEEKPVAAMSAAGLPADLPKRNAWDFISANAVRDELKVDGGDLVSPGGARYRLLQLGGTSERMTLPVLRRIAKLAEEGATIVGNPPTGSPGLDGQAEEYAALVRKLWPGGEVAVIGKGRVIAGRDVEKALGLIGVAPDFAVAAPRPDADVMFVHRRIADGDIYFVNHRGTQAGRFEATFGMGGKAPEIWRADDATIRPASYRMEGGRTVVPLEVNGQDSFFVVFRKSATAQSRSVPAPTTRVIAEVAGPWDVSFQSGRGAPAWARFATLAPLDKNADPGIRYFSGTATYTKVIAAPRDRKPLLLDLGRIGDVAEVRVNGQLAGTAWRAPYRVDIGPLMKRGRNRVEIRVANLWVNRLIGDAQPGAKRITYTGTPTYTADAPLRPSGLIGPVRLLTQDDPAPATR